MLWEEVRLLVGLRGGGGGWSWVESRVGGWAGLAVGVGLNSKGEGLWLTDSILLIRGMYGVTESTSLSVSLVCCGCCHPVSGGALTVSPGM